MSKKSCFYSLLIINCWLTTKVSVNWLRLIAYLVGRSVVVAATTFTESSPLCVTKDTFNLCFTKHHDSHGPPGLQHHTSRFIVLQQSKKNGKIISRTINDPAVNYLPLRPSFSYLAQPSQYLYVFTFSSNDHLEICPNKSSFVVDSVAVECNSTNSIIILLSPASCLDNRLVSRTYDRRLLRPRKELAWTNYITTIIIHWIVWAKRHSRGVQFNSQSHCWTSFQWSTRSIIPFLSPFVAQQQRSDSQRKKNWFNEIQFLILHLQGLPTWLPNQRQSNGDWLDWTVDWARCTVTLLDSINQRLVWPGLCRRRTVFIFLRWGENRNTARRGIQRRTLSKKQWPNRSHREWEVVLAGKENWAKKENRPTTPTASIDLLFSRPDDFLDDSGLRWLSLCRATISS